MLKSLMFGLSLVVALGVANLSLAGGHGGAYPSAQLVEAAPQGIFPSAQGYSDCGAPDCAPAKKKHCLANLLKHREKCYTYEWVLKKKRVRGHKGNGCGDAGCGTAPTCDTCGVYPSGQGAPYAAPQGGYAPASYGAPQGGYAPASYGAGQTFGAGQAYGAGQVGGGYGAGQIAPAGTSAPANTGDGVGLPPAPEPTNDQARNGSLLFLAPAGN